MPQTEFELENIPHDYRRICVIEGCTNRRMSKGNGRLLKLCAKHHREKYGMFHGNSLRKRKRKILNNKCALCGWEGPCDRHRIKAGENGGEYVADNVTVLCPNCHRLLHRAEGVHDEDS